MEGQDAADLGGKKKYIGVINDGPNFIKVIDGQIWEDQRERTDCVVTENQKNTACLGKTIQPSPSLPPSLPVPAQHHTWWGHSLFICIRERREGRGALVKLGLLI